MADVSPVLSQPEVIKQSKQEPAIARQQAVATETAVQQVSDKGKISRSAQLLLKKPEPAAAVVTPAATVEKLVTSSPVTQPERPGVDAITAPHGIGAGQREKSEAAARTPLTTTESNLAFPANQGFQDALPRYDLNPHPLYPDVSRRRGQQGTVLLEVAVQADGVVDTVSVSQSSGYKSLDRAALTAVRRWRFRPATSAGLAVASRVVIPIDFVLHAGQ